MDFNQSDGGQADSRQPIEIGHETPGIVTRPKSLRRCRLLRNEGLAHLRPDLEGLRPDRRPEPGQQLVTRRAQGFDRGFQYSTRQPAPTGMGRRDARAGTVTEQYR